MNLPLVSIITASFDSKNTIKNTIESILNQTYKNIEYIIIDGGSNDTTLEIIRSYQPKFKRENINYKFISEPDNGIYDAFNKGINLAKGSWISFLGADDIYTKNAIEIYSKNIPNKKVDLLYSNVEVIGKKIINGIWSWKNFKRSMNIAHVGALHNRDYFLKYGSFNSSYKIAGDYELLLRAKENLKAHKINELTVIMGSEGISNRYIKKVYQETTKAKRKTAEISSLICQLDYYKWMLKHYLKKIMHVLVR